MARDTLIKTAEKNGIPWRAEADALAADPEVKAAKERLEDAGVAAAYPEYYLQEFHAYDEGNLNWKVCGRGGARVTCVGGAPLLYPLENSDVLTHPVMTGGL